ncbi:MAG TPA: L,D-transpeptidase, partial [Rhodothermales bacterium]|nr:L,D-transpeptidase [Rhodothermales bacterium]
MTRRLVTLLVGLALAVPVGAQSVFYNQDSLRVILDRPQVPLDELPEVYYDYYVFRHPSNNAVLARNQFYLVIGEGDAQKGMLRARLVELLNRKLMREVEIGDTLVIPTAWELDFRAYSPFPRHYAGAAGFDKLFIIHKTIQAFAAYENGNLVRWGVVNTGNKDLSPTPTGRFNFNWQEEHRVSSLSPVGETWDMYWVMNIHLERGVHFHQYAMPTGGPTSHGCIRAIDADARWVYTWADTWQTTGGNKFASIGTRILKPGTTVLIIGDDPADRPHPFTFRRRYPVLMRMQLPDDPYEVPPGSPQQVRWDRERRAQAQRAGVASPLRNAS